jgi:hypothetical protein
MEPAAVPKEGGQGDLIKADQGQGDGFHGVIRFLKILSSDDL